MFLTKWTPRRTLDTLWDAFDRDFLPVPRWFFEDQKENIRLPRTNISEEDQAYVLTMEMPGLSKKDIDVSIEDDTLTVTGERVEKSEEKGQLRKEFQAQKFCRSFSLNGSVDREKVNAKMDNGVLVITLPKKAELAGRKIAVD